MDVSFINILFCILEILIIEIIFALIYYSPLI